MPHSKLEPTNLLPMEHSPSKPAVVETPEIVLNLWYFTDDTGIVIRIAGRAYAMCGSEAEKLRHLTELSTTDFLLALCMPVRSGSIIYGDNGAVLEGAIYVNRLHVSHSFVFSPLIDELEKNFPKPFRSVNGALEQFTLSIPKEPLCVTTAVLEGKDGSLTAVVANRKP